MSHLTIAELLRYADPELDESSRVQARGHLEGCHTCRRRFASLMTMRSALFNVSPKLSSAEELTPSCVPVELMGDYIGARLPQAERAAYSAHMAECDLCFDRAAFFVTSSVRMTEGVLGMAATPARYREAVAPVKRKIAAGKSVSIWDMLGRWVASPVPAYAFAAALLLFMVFGQAGGGAGKIVALDMDKAFIVYEQPEQAAPSFGFSDAGRKVGESPANLSVDVAGRGGKVRFAWNPVDGAADYNFILMEVSARGVHEIYETKTAEPSVSLDEGKLAAGRVYRWKISGSARDNKVFAAIGQFAYAK
ncbi:MAG: hypothetical protein HZB29_10910 [Nitrospinae bacterium]|nr:hypothetical protein [Nitrospinota bacterium]